MLIDMCCEDKTPLVGVLMGSASDLEDMQPACSVLDELGISYEVQIISAHRMPGETGTYAREARERGVEVIIAGAGLSAHLPGALAAHTTLPVIGVPLSGSPLSGQDALYSIVQMPSGVPVAAVGIDAAKNAALLAASILSIKYDRVRVALEKYRENAVEKKREEARRALSQLENRKKGAIQ